MKQNLAWALAYNGLGILLAAFGLLRPVVAVRVAGAFELEFFLARFLRIGIDAKAAQPIGGDDEIDLPVTVRVVLQNPETAGNLVVDRLELLCRRTATRDSD